MSKGVLLFAFNTAKLNYYEMAVATAKRINHFLGLPAAVITNTESLPETVEYSFDKIILVDADKSNFRDWGMWINKGRYQAFDLTPYEETILLDTDYMVNSTRLLTLFELPTDFACHRSTAFLLEPGLPQEKLSPYSFETLWATVVYFKKTTRVKQIFQCLEMVQKNFEHYAALHGFISSTFRNDYGLTLALRIANGHSTMKSDSIPWDLLHVGNTTTVQRVNDNEFNTEYIAMHRTWVNGKSRMEYLVIKDTDFHVMQKTNFMELIAK